MRSAPARCVGQAPRLSPHSRARRQAPEPCRLDEPARRSAPARSCWPGRTSAPGATVAAGAFVRERARDRRRQHRVGPGAAVDNDVVVGDRVTIGAGAYVTAGSLVEDDVSVGAGVVTTNDDTMSRHAPDDGAARGDPAPGLPDRRSRGAGARRARSGAGATVAAEAVVTRDVPEGAQRGGRAGPGGRAEMAAGSGSAGTPAPVASPRGGCAGGWADHATRWGWSRWPRWAAVAALELGRVWRRGQRAAARPRPTTCSAPPRRPAARRSRWRWRATARPACARTRC